ncbi:hypothetical protein K438DRAFT_1789396 [Mycena galopus ATCC 62051]|nr:hypothetical protein K438DRAFT_1789396 [Mycena galopus ATCC 62051]
MPRQSRHFLLALSWGSPGRLLNISHQAIPLARLSLLWLAWYALVWVQTANSIEALRRLLKSITPDSLSMPYAPLRGIYVYKHSTVDFLWTGGGHIFCNSVDEYQGGIQ